MKKNNIDLECVPEIYFVFACLGKTYYCQHNLGWIDLDTAAFSIGHSLSFAPEIVDFYARCGYKILTNASCTMIQALGDYIRNKTGKGLIVYLPEKTEEAKNFLIKNCEQRGYPTRPIKELIYGYYEKLERVESLLNDQDTIIRIPPGQFLSDFLKK